MIDLVGLVPGKFAFGNPNRLPRRRGKMVFDKIAPSF